MPNEKEIIIITKKKKFICDQIFFLTFLISSFYSFTKLFFIAYALITNIHSERALRIPEETRLNGSAT